VQVKDEIVKCKAGVRIYVIGFMRRWIMAIRCIPSMIFLIYSNSLLTGEIWRLNMRII